MSNISVNIVSDLELPDNIKNWFRETLETYLVSNNVLTRVWRIKVFKVDNPHFKYMRGYRSVRSGSLLFYYEPPDWINVYPFSIKIADLEYIEGYVGGNNVLYVPKENRKQRGYGEFTVNMKTLLKHLKRDCSIIQIRVEHYVR